MATSQPSTQAVHPTNGKWGVGVPGTRSSLAGGVTGQDYVRRPGDRMTGPLSTTGLEVEDQAGEGNRLVVAKTLGFQFAPPELKYKRASYPRAQFRHASVVAGASLWHRFFGPVGESAAIGQDYDGVLWEVRTDGSKVPRGSLPLLHVLTVFNADGTKLAYGDNGTVIQAYEWNGLTWTGPTSSDNYETLVATDGGYVAFDSNRYLRNYLWSGALSFIVDLGENVGAGSSLPLTAFSAANGSFVLRKTNAAVTARCALVVEGSVVTRLKMPTGYQWPTSDSSAHVAMSPDGLSVYALLASTAGAGTWPKRMFVSRKSVGAWSELTQVPLLSWSGTPGADAPVCIRACGTDWFALADDNTYDDFDIYTSDGHYIQSFNNSGVVADNRMARTKNGAIFHISHDFGAPLARRDPMRAGPIDNLVYGAPAKLTLDYCDLRVTEHSGSGVRLEAAGPDGDMAPIDELSWDASLSLLSVSGSAKVTDQLTADRIHLNIAPASRTRVEGDLVWNPVDHTIDVHPDVAGATLQVGQENWLRVVNKTGATLTGGTVVYIDDAQGSRPTVAKSDASQTSTVADRTIGVVTADIANNAEGYVVTFGLLRGYNTSAWGDGDPVWVNPATPGGLTNVEPSAPDHRVRVGYALNSAVNGSLFIAPHYVGELPRQNAAMKEPTGFEDPSAIAVSYDSTTRTVTLTQSGGVVYWFRGVRYQLTSPWTSAAHTATDGPWFLSFGTAGAMSWSQTVWDLETSGPVCYVNYNTPTGITFAIREVHGLLQWQAHREMHDQIGTYRRSGGTPTAGTYTLSTDTNAAITPGFDAAVVADEDLQSTISAVSEGSYTHLRIAAGSVVAFRTAESYLTRTTGTYPNWNDPATGAETESANGDFLNVYQVLIPVTSDSGSQTYRMVFLQPQAAYSTLLAAKGEDFRSLSLGSLTAVATEFCAFTRLTFSVAAANTTVGKVKLVDITYLTGSRASQAVTSAVTPTSHTVLADRSAAAQHPASSISFAPTAEIPATTTQAAIASMRYTHVQSVAAAMWTITHNLGCYPSVTVVDSGGTVGWCQVQYVSANQLTVTVSAAFAGTAYLN